MKKSLKQVIFFTLLILSIIILYFLTYFYWPRSITETITFEGPLKITFTEYVDTELIFDLQEDKREYYFEIAENSEQYQKIVDVLSKYNYRLFKGTITKSTHYWRIPIYTFIIEDNNNIMRIDDNAELFLKGHTYKIGYYKNTKSIILCEELKDILKKN